jgi:hypothetical protein
MVMLLLLYSKKMNLQCSMDRRLDGPQSRSGGYEGKKILTLPGAELMPYSL